MTGQVCVGSGYEYDAGHLRWRPFHGEARRAATQSIANGTWTTVQFDTITAYNDASWIAGSWRWELSGTGVGAVGWWDLAFTMAWSEASLVGLRAIRLLRNGSDVIALEELDASDAYDDMTTMFSGKATFGDKVAAQVYQSSGGNLSIRAAEDNWDTPLFTATYWGGNPS